MILFSLYYLAEPFLKSVPEEVARQLEREHPGETWEYGRDWINLGYRPGAGVLIQAIPKSENLAELFEKDARGNRISELPAFSGLRTLKQIAFLAEFTGLVGSSTTTSSTSPARTTRRRSATAVPPSPSRRRSSTSIRGRSRGCWADWRGPRGIPSCCGSASRGGRWTNR